MIIFINGPINSGKSTVAKILAEKLPKFALLEIDVLRDMISWMPIDQVIPINLENAVFIIKNFVKNKINVVVPYPLSKNNYDYLMDQFKDIEDKIYTFTLAPKLEKTLTNRGTRELTEKEKDRIKYHYDIGIHAPNFGEIIDNSNQTPKETVKIIIDKL